MPTREFFLLRFSSPGSPLALPEGFLRERRGILLRNDGDGLLGAFESAAAALEAAQELRRRVPHGRGGLTRGPSSPVPDEAALLASRAMPGALLASAPFVRGLSDPGRFREVSPDLFEWTTEGDGKELFDFSRAEQERALEARIAPPEHHRAASDEPIPFAVGPPEPTERRPESRGRPLPYRPKRSRGFQRALWALLIFGVIVPAALVGLWWGAGVLQRGDVPPGDEEIRQRLESSDALRALQTKRPEGATASEIARGTYATYGTLLVESEPAGAEVFVDGRKAEGVTPLKVRRIAARTPLHVAIRKAGYDDSEQLLTLSPEEEKTVSVKLERVR